MSRNLLKAVAMRLLFITILLFAAVALGQEFSNGDTPLSTKVYANQWAPDCKLTDIMHTFYNLKSEHCDLFTTFRNGEIRWLTSTDGLLYSDAAQRNAFAQTACPHNATWLRDTFTVTDTLTHYIKWELRLFPRNADGSFSATGARIFEWETCRVYRQVAGGGDGGGEPAAGGGTPGAESPIVIDLNNDGVVRLTNKADGVKFDLDRNKEKEQLPWLADADDGWLVHDFNFGDITSGAMLFGPGSLNNGYLHLAGFDDNKDGQIDASDGVFSMLAIWQDKNHNGLSEPGELTPLPYSKVKSISLDFKESRRKDRHGNEFRYRSRIEFIDGSKGFSFDVFLTAD